MAQQMIIGIDLAKHVFQVCMVTPTGTLKTNTTVARGKLLTFIARQPPALIFMEACGGAHDGHDAFARSVTRSAYWPRNTCPRSGGGRKMIPMLRWH
jgi:hypothetical protein